MSVSLPGRTVLWLTGRMTDWDEVERIRRRIDRFAALGWEAEVVCAALPPAGPSMIQELASEGIVACPGLDSTWRRVFAVRRFRFDSDEGRPDLLHILDPEMAAAGLDLAEHARLPYLLSIDEFLPEGAVLRIGERSCVGLVATDSDLADDLARSMGVPRDRIHVVPEGVEPIESIAPEVAEPRSTIPVVGVCSGFGPGSGLSTFLNAARQVVDLGIDAEFVICGLRGDAEGEATVRRRAERLRLAERFTLAHDAVLRPTFWRVLDVYCQPASSPSVGSPLLQAQARGIPVVATDVPGLRGRVRDGETGRLVAPNQSDAMARAITRLIEEPDEADRLGRAGRDDLSSAHDPDREAKAWAALYEETSSLKGIVRQTRVGQ
jgi:glycosyltransferase involved in cell wall biosynthesis